MNEIELFINKHKRVLKNSAGGRPKAKFKRRTLIVRLNDAEWKLLLELLPTCTRERAIHILSNSLKDSGLINTK